MNISNKTRQALTVPLLRGKTLRLGPGKTGQIDAKAAALPALKKLIAAGDIEILDGGRTIASKGTGAIAATDAAKARVPH